MAGTKSLESDCDPAFLFTLLFEVLQAFVGTFSKACMRGFANLLAKGCSGGESISKAWALY